MDLFFQCGYGMKNIIAELSDKWSHSTAILSPRDVKPNQLQNWKNELKKHNVEFLFDPQYYYDNVDHKGLLNYEYFEKNCSKEKIIEIINKYNAIADTSAFIIPSKMLDFDEEWLNNWEHESIEWITISKKIVKNKKLIFTLAFPEELLVQSEDMIEKVIEIINSFDIEYYYIIAYPKKEKYLVDTPMWLANLLQICASLKLSGKKVIVGYANAQHLCLSACKVDAIASGNFMNVRKFSKDKFSNNKEMKRKNIWYYHPQSLSEYKMGFLDLAFNAGIIDYLKPSDDMKNEYSDVLFNKQLPSSVNFKESDSFKHYLYCLKIQTINLTEDSFENSINKHVVMINSVKKRIEKLQDYGVFGGERSFNDTADVYLSALIRLERVLGFNLKREWNNIDDNINFK